MIHIEDKDRRNVKPQKQVRCFDCDKILEAGQIRYYIDREGFGVPMCQSCLNKHIKEGSDGI